MEEKIQVRMAEEADNLFKNDYKARKTLSSGGRRILIMVIILIVIFLCSVCLMPFGILGGMYSRMFGGEISAYVSYTLAEYRDLVSYRTTAFISLFVGDGMPTFVIVLVNMAVATLAGFAMSVTGAVYQGVFNNPMASPTTMGVNAGGTLGGLFYILVLYGSTSVGQLVSSHTTASGVVIYQASDMIEAYYSMNLFQRCAQELCVLAGCFAGVGLILLISMIAGRGRISTVALLLAGSVFSTVVSEIGQLLQYYYSTYGDEDTSTAINTLLGATGFVGDFQPVQLLFMAVPIAFCTILIFAFSGKLNILVFGEEEARALGVNITTFRNLLIVLCTILSAVVLSFCGQVSMVGFMMPHFARYIVGPDFKKLVPTSAMLGGITTLLVYDLCYMIGDTSSFNMYTGVLCSIMSAIFIVRYRRNRHADWS